jgi:hypothetical protein
MANSGGGGGGAGDSSAATRNGGSGVVIIKYAKGSLTAPTVTNATDLSTDDDYIYAFKSSTGSIEWSDS